MLLLTGPPGSGKTRYVLERIRDASRRGAVDTLLLTPTKTMAEHLGNEMVRVEGVFRPGIIRTLNQFLRGFQTGFEQSTPTLMRYVVRQCLEKEPPEKLASVAGLPGFQRAAGDLVNELSEAGARAHEFRRHLLSMESAPDHGAALAEIVTRVDDELLKRGKLTRGDRIRAVARKISEEGAGDLQHVLFDGFFTFSRAEAELVRAIAGHADVTVTLPPWAGSEGVRESLLNAGFEEKVLERVRPEPEYEIVKAENQDGETVEVARRILEEARKGRRFSEIGIVIRSVSPYRPVIESALARFGIPARFYFPQELLAQPVVQRLARTIEAWRSGWELEAVLDAVRLAPAGARRDRLEFAIRERMPDRGLGVLLELDKAEAAGSREHLERLDGWRAGKAKPTVWKERFLRLPRLFPTVALRDGISHEEAGAIRRQVEALDSYERAVGEAAGLLAESGAVSLDEFWLELRLILEEGRLYGRDRRRNVVHVIDAVEARQWELPLVFVCGLIEEEFPKRHSDSALLPDAARQAFWKRGFPLATSVDREREEEFLFELARSCGIERTVLSYPAHNAKGEPALPSFLLGGLRDSLGRKPESDTKARLARPRSGRARALPWRPRIHAEELLEEIARRCRRMSPTSVERFLDCPFQFFANTTLRLKEPPAEPEDRLDMLVLGSIVHEALAKIGDGGEGWEPAFQAIFDRRCETARAPDGCLKEKLRLEAVRSLEKWFASGKPPPAAESLAERTFEMEIAPGAVVHGRVDRLDRYENGGALVIDYKYSAVERLKEYITGTEEGRRVQAGLYLSAARRAFGLQPEGMLYCALKTETRWDGWHVKRDGLQEFGTACVPEVIADKIKVAEEKTVEVSERIRAGEIAPAPAGEETCRYCSYEDVCRVKEMRRSAAAGGEGG